MWHHLSRSRSISAIPCPMEHGQGMGERRHTLPWGRALRWGTASTRSPQPLPASLLPVAAVPSCPETRTPRWAAGPLGLVGSCRAGGSPDPAEARQHGQGSPTARDRRAAVGAAVQVLVLAVPTALLCLPGLLGGEAPLIHCKCQITNRF